MIIKYLKIHNIASIADAEINFSEGTIGDTSIFLISGETGSGKSTILDAICLALYDKTPRMSSVSKEEIGFVQNVDDKYYFNDNSQFLRRGTGKGYVKLLFEGNDGKDYEACWYIQRNYKKPDKRLQKPNRSLSSIDGKYAETNKRVITDKIRELTGLDYDQFCRTVLLAQGEFSKFLKSDRGEKSGILERLTGTEVYSIIGKKIADRYLEKKSIWEDAKRDVRNIILFDKEEIESRKNRIHHIEEESKRLSKEKSDTAKKLNWIRERHQLSRLKASTEKKIEVLESVFKSDSFIYECGILKDFKLSEEARQLYKERTKCINLINTKEKLYSRLQENLSSSQNSIVMQQKKTDEIQNELNQIALKAEYFDLKTINEELFQLNNRFQSIGELCGMIKNAEIANTRLKDLTTEADTKRKTIEECDRIIESLESPLKSAESELTKATGDLEKIELATSDAVNAIRMSVKEGDICPVCGNKIEKIISDDAFSSLLDTLRTRKRHSESALLKLRSDIFSTKRLKAESQKSLENIEISIRKQSEAVALCQKAVNSQITKCEYSTTDHTNLSEILDKDRRNLSLKISEKRKIQKEAENTHRQVSSLQKSLDKSKNNLETLKEEFIKVSTAMTEWKTDKRINEERMHALTISIRNFLNDNSHISEDRLQTLCDMDKDSIEEIEASHKKIHDNINLERGAFANLSVQLLDLEDNKPEITEEESEEALNEAVATVEHNLNLIQREIGQIKEQLATDMTARIEFDKKIKKEEEARKEKEEWEGLYKLLGDTDGAKFRNVAQSFILRSLLENANVYMRNFTDRYTLTCNPGSLAILVKDTYHPSDPQPASILSGGECFMASLSLALALSNLRSGGSPTDILFIDEGFGSLSPEYLENVMDTLEKLHQIGGRKVGLISHVPEMKERIPVQIQVDRESPALSCIKIVDYS